MIFFENFWWLLVLIGVMILVHELGHFWAARLFDVHVEVFSFGFGPRLFGFRRGETDFRFSAILFGGYVKMLGEQPGDEAALRDPRSFQAKPRWQRLIIAAAGPLMNVLLSIALLSGLYMYQYPKPLSAEKPAVVGYVAPGSPAAKAGIQEGDRILQIADRVAPSWEDVLMTEAANANRPITVAVERNGQRLHLTLTPRLDEKMGIGAGGWDEKHEVIVGGFVAGMDAERAGLRRGDKIVRVNGVPVYSIPRLHELIRSSGGNPVEVTVLRDGQERTVRVRPSLSQAEGGEQRWMLGVQLERPYTFVRLPFPDAVREAVRQNVRYATVIYQFLGGILERRMSPKSLEGPIRIAQLSGDAAREGPTAFIGLMAMVSLNLAVFNLLPIPILDGGLILLLLIEMVLRRDLSMAVKEAVYKAGMVFLMIVVAFVLYNDIAKILPG